MTAATQLVDGSDQPYSVTSRIPVGAVLKPFDYTTAGHYRVNHRCALVATQAANSRLFELRNPSATPVIITQLIIRWLQTAAHTAAIEDSLDIFKVTGFTLLDNTNIVTPVASKARTSMGNSAVTLAGVTVAGAAAGMTGGTMSKDNTSVGQLPQWLLAAVPTASQVAVVFNDNQDDNTGTHPIVLANNEGLIIENRVLLGAAAGSSVYIDASWAEVATF